MPKSRFCYPARLYGFDPHFSKLLNLAYSSPEILYFFVGTIPSKPKNLSALLALSFHIPYSFGLNEHKISAIVMEMSIIRAFRLFRVARVTRVTRVVKVIKVVKITGTAKVTKAAKAFKLARKMPKLRKTVKKFRRRKHSG